MNTVIAGRMYNGKAYEWETKDNDERTLFRGRLNYRNPENGEYYWIDAVCFRDFGDKGGLVAWLDENYSTEVSENENGGDAIIVTGYIRPTTKRKTVELRGKKNGKTITKEIPNVPYDTFEFVILSATFPPTSQGEGRPGNDVDIEDELDDFDDLEVADGEEENDDEEVVEEVKEKPAPKIRRKKESSSTKKPSSRKKEKVVSDEDFFEN